MSGLLTGIRRFSKLFRANGYQTAIIGKIHLDGPQGFDYSRVLTGRVNIIILILLSTAKGRKQGYSTDIITNLALDWLKKRDPDKPFCLLYHHKAPHRKWLPEEKYYKEYIHKTLKNQRTYR